ncbi:hypothetical protein TNCT_126921 [Trichonephila clavata]|uniref:Uncharacterized protein n=1 Tax=Trichonephila clavata TaxID=2740835 RepID=A0A8X6LKE5_TRICU|nr:hypothetical protein TNCT_126921 [Trichonephila clavata]
MNRRKVMSDVTSDGPASLKSQTHLYFYPNITMLQVNNKKQFKKETPIEEKEVHESEKSESEDKKGERDFENEVLMFGGLSIFAR